jgi:hypothetical protein
MPVTATLKAHRIGFLFECSGVTDEAWAALAHVTLGEVAPFAGALDWLDPDRIEPGSSERPLRARPVWLRKELPSSEDLHPSVRAILDAFPQAESQQAPAALGLSDYSRNLVAGRYRRLPPVAAGTHRGWTGAVLTLGEAAVRRLGLAAPAQLQMHIDEVGVFVFRTGVGIALVEASFSAANQAVPSPELLIEALHLVSDEQRAASLRWADAGAGEGSGFRLSDLLRPLFAGNRIGPVGRRRVYSYTAALIEGDIDPGAQQDIALRLSRHYNYSYTPETFGTEIYRPFAPVVHALSIEGAATVVDLSPAPNDASASATGLPPDFLVNWIENAHSRAYLPILLVAFHEYLALLDLAQSAAVDVDFRGFTDREATALQRLCDRFLAVRLRYRPPLVSSITMHNSFHELVRRVLGLDALSRKAGQDLVEAELRLSRFAAERERRAREAAQHRLAWHAAFIAGALSFLVVNGIFRQIAELIQSVSGKANIIVEAAGIGLGVLAAAAGAFAVWHGARHGARRREREDGEDLHVAHISLG